MRKPGVSYAILIFLALSFSPVFFRDAASAMPDGLLSTLGLPDGIPREAMPENYTTEDYVNTTNPYSNGAGVQSAIDEVDDPEGPHPLYVLIFGDEEERSTIHEIPHNYLPWSEYAKVQAERGDEALVVNFGIDIRILGFMEWDSDDSLTTMAGLWYELKSETNSYLRGWFNSEWWGFRRVDAIIGITNQQTNDRTVGLAPGPDLVDAGDIYLLLKWQVYWADDNEVQHEVGHLYYAPDHYHVCCSMANHTHRQVFIWEDVFWYVGADVPCSSTAYLWCNDPVSYCNSTMHTNCGRYPLRTLYILIYGGGTTDPPEGALLYANGTSVAVTAVPWPGYIFSHWALQLPEPCHEVYDNPVTVLLDCCNPILRAYFVEPVCAMKTQVLGAFSSPSIDALHFLRVELLFDNAYAEGDQKGGVSPYSSIAEWPDGKIDITDLNSVSALFGTYEGHPRWKYMSDITGDKKCDLKDCGRVSANFGHHDIAYSTDLTGLIIHFDTGQEVAPSPNGFVSIPNGTTSFIVYRDDNPIGALITFHRL